MEEPDRDRHLHGTFRRSAKETARFSGYSDARQDPTLSDSVLPGSDEPLRHRSVSSPRGAETAKSGAPVSRFHRVLGTRPTTRRPTHLSSWRGKGGSHARVFPASDPARYASRPPRDVSDQRQTLGSSGDSTLFLRGLSPLSAVSLPSLGSFLLR